jgi:hypothetical protein
VCWSSTKWTSSSFHWKLTCSRHDIAKKIAELALNNSYLLTDFTLLQVRPCISCWNLLWKRFLGMLGLITYNDKATQSSISPIGNTLLYISVCNIFPIVSKIFEKNFLGPTWCIIVCNQSQHTQKSFSE